MSNAIGGMFSMILYAQLNGLIYHPKPLFIRVCRDDSTPDYKTNSVKYLKDWRGLMVGIEFVDIESQKLIKINHGDYLIEETN